MVDALIASMDLKSVEESLVTLGFGKVEETDEELVFYCQVCFENNPPPLSDKNVAGCFTLDMKVLAAQKSLKPENQPRSLSKNLYQDTCSNHTSAQV